MCTCGNIVYHSHNTELCKVKMSLLRPCNVNLCEKEYVFGVLLPLVFISAGHCSEFNVLVRFWKFAKM